MAIPEMDATQEAVELARFAGVEDATFEAYLSDYVLALPVCKGCH